MQVKCIAGSILQYFCPSLSYEVSLRPLFCLFLSGRFTQVLLYRYVIFLPINGPLGGPPIMLGCGPGPPAICGCRGPPGIGPPMGPLGPGPGPPEKIA